MKILKIKNSFENYKYKHGHKHNFKMIEPIKKPKNNKDFKTILKEVEVMNNVR